MRTCRVLGVTAIATLVLAAGVAAIGASPSLASSGWSGPTSTPIGGGVISCVSASFCAGASDNGTPNGTAGATDGNAQIYNGSTWNSQTGVIPYYDTGVPGAWGTSYGPTDDPGINSVSCVSTSFCAAAGFVDLGESGTVDPPYNAAVSFYYGNFWTAPQYAGLSFWTGYYAPSKELVSCTSTSFCVVVAAGVAATNTQFGYSGTGESSTFNGHTWTAPVFIDTSPTSGGSGTGPFASITSLSCAPATTFCAAVDSNGDAMTFDGSTWSAPEKVDVTNSLVSLSCASPSFCVAVDNSDNVYTYTGSWSGPAVVGFGSLDAVSCGSVSFCDAVFGTGDVSTYNGVSWSTPVNIDNAALDWIDCASSTFCFAEDSNGKMMTYSMPTPPASGATGSTAGATAAASVGHASVNGKTASVNVTCTGAATSSCAIFLDLTTIRAVEGVSATVGSKRITLAGGQSETVKIALNATGQMLLAIDPKLPISLTGMVGTQKLSTQTITFRARA